MDRREKLGRRLVMSATGVGLTGVGVGVLQATRLGVDPYTSFVSGFQNLMHLPYSVTYWIVTACLLVTAFIFGRRLLYIATVLNLVFLGLIADGVRFLLEPVLDGAQLPLRLVFLVIGLLILGFSAALYYTADLGVSAYDAQALMLHQNIVRRGPFRYCRIFTDAVCTAVGFVLHADIGIATLITALFMGPLIDLFTKTVALPLLGIKEDNV